MKLAPRLPYGTLVIRRGLLSSQREQLCVIIGTFRYNRNATGLEDCFGVRPETCDVSHGYIGYLLMPSSGAGPVHSFWFDVETGDLRAV